MKTEITNAATRLQHKSIMVADKLDEAAKLLGETAGLLRNLVQDPEFSAVEIVTIGDPGGDTLQDTVSKGVAVGEIMTAFQNLLPDATKTERRQAIGAVLQQATGRRPSICDGPSVKKFLTDCTLAELSAIKGGM